ncbi:family 10 glycosylhydrolase [Cellulosilyticum sp. I15G10I2]|uniref:family 10 glycosylhydrolase n=1 Tax=Cellulosilyticum sp. I15G10I2 TaxID=1892843 RepID=UPI00085BD3E8|nr:family 10 glycosylhydrolase [Cellulosilyticum sp. I15G10I2]
MKKLLALVTIIFMATSMLSTHASAALPSQDMRAVWIATVFNIDYPSTKNNETSQKEEYIKKLEELKAIGINAVVLQVRPKADALYQSNINPWSDVLTGVQGRNPGYDPMAFMIEEAHKRGMTFHAWLNPYRVTTAGIDLNALSSDHPARKNPSWVFSYNNALYYNPESQEVKNHIVATVEEIIKNYNVDGIHFDDYFYPSHYPLPAGEGKDGAVANNRRAHINDMVKQVSAAIKRLNTNIQFGISPIGIWKNNTSDITGSSTGGNESYYAVAADTRTWIKNEWIDYVVPQIYWETGHRLADYETLVKWWANEVKDTKVKLYIGQGIYRDVVAAQIDTQLKINQKYEAVKGSFYFSMRELLANRLGCKDKIKAFNESAPLAPTLPGQMNPASPAVKTPNIAAKTGTVTASPLNMRSGEGTQHPVVAKIAKGTKVSILDSKAGWYQVQLASGQKGWVSASFIQVATTTNKAAAVSNTAPGAATKTATVTASSLNVRSGASTGHLIVAKAAKGTKVSVLESNGAWAKVQLASGKIGWVSQAFIK